MKLKFYKDSTEAIKILLPGSVLMFIVAFVTFILTSISVVDGTYAEHVYQFFV